MNTQDRTTSARRPGFLPRADLQTLIDHLHQAGYRVLAPLPRDGGLQYRELTSVAQFTPGLTNEQRPGHYRLQAGEGERLFDWNHGPQGLKPLCFAPSEVLWTEQSYKLSFEAKLPEVVPTAVIGVRACDLAALAIQDRHFLHPDAPDPQYRARRESLFLVGVDCAHSAETCFCVSTGDGPSVGEGLDIGMAELDEGYLLWAGSERGHALLQTLDTHPADDPQLEQMQQQTDQATEEQQRQLPAAQDLMRLYQRLEHLHWQVVGDRCLSCGNCTAVCPTCFCYNEIHERSLDGQSAQRLREWDSCFSASHSSMGHFKVRNETSQRYRQWATHKLAGWQVQQGRTGCTGCGRCIAWCPVGIDLVQEVNTILWEGSIDA
ncbi:MAG: 4Fe-4S dicluster domain-containing protein [Candidatus Thiodiazotropha sp.]